MQKQELQVIKYHQGDLTVEEKSQVDEMCLKNDSLRKTFSFYERILNALSNLGGYHQHELMRIWKEKLKEL